jgi:hypothetical protein
MRPEIMTEAEFARHRQVSRVTVLNWKRRGAIIMRGSFVDVEPSDAALNERLEVYRGGRKSPNK